MTTQHTQGRLTVRSRYGIYTADSQAPVAHTILVGSVFENSEANARRLVACWNYFEKLGWATEEIEAAS